MTSSELGIAHVGLGEQDVQRLKGVMVKAIMGGLVKPQWRLSEPAAAHFIVAGVEEAGRTDSALLAYTRSTVAVLAGESDRVVKGYRRLAWPIRLEELVAHLKAIEAQVNGDSEAPVHSLMRLAEVLRQPEVVPDAALRIDGLTRGPAYFLPARKVFVCADSLMRLGRFDMTGDVRFDWVPLPSVPESPEQHKPVVMLQWWVGLLTGSVGLLPWLRPDGPLRLRRFPDFPILHHLPAHRRLAAALSRPVASIEAVAALTGLQPAMVVGFVNAADLCGYLVGAELHAETARVPRASGSTTRSLVQVFRRALGIEVSDG